jgi:uncharacterized membrane protein
MTMLTSCTYICSPFVHIWTHQTTHSIMNPQEMFCSCLQKWTEQSDVDIAAMVFTSSSVYAHLATYPFLLCLPCIVGNAMQQLH